MTFCHLRQTIQDGAFDAGLFQKLNLGGEEEEDQDVLSYHARLLIAHLATTWELRYFFMSFPWRAASALLEKHWEPVLRDMELDWEFVLKCVDPVGNDKVGALLQHTRYQVYRDIMTKAE